MNYGQIRDYILQLINRYTVAGEKYQPSYNNQQDYLLKIPALVNDALVYIASGVRRIPAQRLLRFSDGTVQGRYRAYGLPEDCIEVRSGGLLMPSSSGMRYVTDYIVLEPNTILVPREVEQDMVLEYYRLPQLLPDKVSEDYRIDAAPDVQMAVCYYVAAHLVMFDDEFIYTSLYKEFENKAARLIQPPAATAAVVCDVYESEGAWGTDV